MLGKSHALSVLMMVMACLSVHVWSQQHCQAQTTVGEIVPNNSAVLQLKARWKELMDAPDELKGKEALAKIKELAAQVPSDSRVGCVLGMMEVEIPDSVASNEYLKRFTKISILAMFGENPLPPNETKLLLASDKLDVNQDLLLRGYYELMESSVTKGPITKQGGQLLARLLSGEVGTVAGRNLSQEKRDRLIALSLSVLNSSQGLDDMWTAFETYRTQANNGDLFALYIHGWQQVKNPGTASQPWERAALELGHWSETARYSAASRLGEEADKVNAHDAMKAIHASLSDPRPLVQEAAATACQRHSGTLTQAMIEKLVAMLNSPKPEYSRQAALALSRHVKDPGADKALPILWEKLVKPVRESIEKRGAWEAMSGYQAIMTAQQKRQLCEQAAKDISDYTFSVLCCLDSMGRDAAPARHALKEYLKSAKSGDLADHARRILQDLPADEGPLRR